jgi:hypothetical protein
MKSPWIPWNPHEIFIKPPWNTHKIPMKSPWNLPWKPIGIPDPYQSACFAILPWFSSPFRARPVCKKIPGLAKRRFSDGSRGGTGSGLAHGEGASCFLRR